jgi:hypothetical protein
MSNDLTKPTRQAIAARNRSAPGKVTGRLKDALLKMVWEGACRADAAKAAGMTDHSLRASLKKPHVKAYYLAELQVLRTSERARNVFALVDVRDRSENQAARVAAVRTLEELADGGDRPGGAGGASVMAGLVVRIVGGAPEPKMIEHEPVPSKDEPSE